jgi:hypothetical protein
VSYGATRGRRVLTPAEITTLLRVWFDDAARSNPGGWIRQATVEVIGSTLLVTTDDQRFVIRIHEDKGWRR